MLRGKTVVVGVTGGIAAYKSAELVRELRKLKADVHVIMTENAEKFITPLTMQTLSQNQVITGMFEKTMNWNIEHISLAKKADIILIVPATANIVGKIANGIADDMLSTTIMASTAPAIFACSMNNNMYENQIVQNNISKLKKLGYLFVEPEYGYLACNEEGKGRLAEIENIIKKTLRVLRYTHDLAGKTVLITAGPTKEYIDPIRFLSNNSSGKMGYSIAEAASARGAKVILISGPVELKAPYDVEAVFVESAEEMHAEVIKRYDCADIIIMAAAVADFRAKTIAQQKIKKAANDELSIELKKNPDILKEIAEHKGKRTIVGFAAETEELEKNALIKLKNKNLDIIVANNITEEGCGFKSDMNIVKIINKFGMIKDLPVMHKLEVAEKILDEIISIEKTNESIKA